MVLAAGLVVWAAVGAMAQHAGDIGLGVEGSRIVTGEFDEGSGTVVVGRRVFASDLGELAPNFSDEPGFDSEPGTFQPGTAIAFDMPRAVRRFGGNDFDEVEGLFSIEFGPLSVLTPTTDVETPGFSIGVGSNGQWHHHLAFTLQPPASDGVYLLELRLRSTQAGLAPSEPFWLVFSQNADEGEHARAQRIAMVTLAGVCAADFDDGSATGEPDGGVTVDDLLYYLDLFGAGDPFADTDDGTGQGVYDGGVTIDDLLYYLERFGAGC